MAFLHNETTGTIKVLTQDGEKSSYIEGASIRGHFKPYSLEDGTFDVGGIDGSLYKFTTKGDVTISGADKIDIDGKTYLVKNVKKYRGIGFNTTKILLSYK